MKVNANQSLEGTLESAVAVCWADLMHDSQTGLIHIEYGFAQAGTLDYLKFWASATRGHWLLACEYWMSESGFHGVGLRFENGFESVGLAHLLESVMQNQTCFVLPENMGRQGLLQISSPTAEELVTAKGWIAAALDRLGEAVVEPALV